MVHAARKIATAAIECPAMTIKDLVDVLLRRGKRLYAAIPDTQLCLRRATTAQTESTSKRVAIRWRLPRRDAIKDNDGHEMYAQVFIPAGERSMVRPW